ncbi:MAG: hypothetical protein M3R17_06650 [Bacteroidota bacterium]|nr:hypothetical protein [Bacteroidota bacterium]
MKNKLLLFVAVLTLSITATHAATHAANQVVASKQLNTISEPTSKSGDIMASIREYMADYGIIAMYIVEEQGTTNYLVKDTNGIWYRVYVTNGYVGGYNQVDF